MRSQRELTSRRHGPYQSATVLRFIVATSVLGIGAMAASMAFEVPNAAAAGLTPTVSSISPSAGPTAGGTEVAVSGSEFEDGLESVEFGTTPAAIDSYVSTSLIDVTAPAGSGTQPIRVHTDLGGTSAITAGSEYTYDPVPTVSGVSPNLGLTTGGTSVTVSGTGFVTGATVKFGGTAAGSVTVKSSTSITATAPAAAAGTVNVTVTTPGGISTTSSADDFTYNALPTVSAVAPNAGPLAAGTTVTITGTGFVTGATVKFGTVAAAGVTVISATSITATAPAGSAGTVNVTVTTPGGTSATSSADAFTYEAVPTVTAVVPTAGPTGGGTSVTITGTGFAAGATVAFGTVGATSVTVTSATSITATAPAGSAGTVNVTVTTLGGTSATSSADDFTYDAGPSVTALSPDAGPTAGGTAVTISGTGFVPGTTVKFGTVAATAVTVTSATSITATAPAGSQASVDVTVTTPGGTSATNSADEFTYEAAPQVASVSPDVGPISGGTVVDIQGYQFVPGSTVNFGTVAATDVSVDPYDLITATSPPGSGTVDVTVSSPGGTSLTSTADIFTYGGPTLTSVDINYGTAGSMDLLYGTGFTQGATVAFGSTSVASLEVFSSTEIEVTVPAAPAGSIAPITVTTAYGASATSPATTYFYEDDLPVPTVTSVSPNFGPVSGGTMVTLTGSGFAAGDVLAFGAQAVSYSLVSSTEMEVDTPAFAAVTVYVEIVTTQGESSPFLPNSSDLANCFTFGAPTVTGVSPTFGPVGGGMSVTIAGQGFGGTSGSGISVEFGGVAATSIEAIGPTQITATAPAGSAGTVNVTVTSPEGTSPTSSADDFTYDAGPTVTALSPDAGPTAGGTAVTISGTGFVPGTTVKFGTVAATAVTVVSSTDITATAPAGTGTVNVTVTTPGGTSAASVSNLYAYGAPSVTAVSPTAGSTTGGTAVAITGTGFVPGATVDFGTVAATGVTVISATSITATAPAGSAGTINVTVTTPGGTSATSSADDYTYVVAPTVTALSPNAGPTAGGTAVTITGTGFVTGATIKFGTVAATGVTVVSSTDITATAPAGTGTVNVTVTTAGGTSAASVSNLYAYGAPSVTALSPDAGPTAGGTAVTISGTGFVPGTTVKFGTVAATAVTVTSATSITATAPAGTGTVNVTVTTPGGTSAASVSNLYAYGAPSVTALSPDAGPTAGGTAVTISGTGFVPGTTVAFGGVAATQVVVVSSTQITATSPGGTGAVNITVTTSAGSSPVTASDLFAYGAPSVSAVSPSSGSPNGGTAVTITGTGFVPGSTVHFGTVSGTTVVVISGTSISVVSPGGSSTVNVTVSTPAGTSATSPSDVFTYNQLPVVSQISPYSGSTSGGTTVTITGYGFTSGATVEFGGVSAQSVSYQSATGTLSAVSPSHAAGLVDITVTTPGGTSATSSADQFIYGAPVVEEVTPDDGTTDTTVTIYGSGFAEDATVSFGSTPAVDATVDSSSEITAIAPAVSGIVNVTVSDTAGTSSLTSADDYANAYVCGPQYAAAATCPYSDDGQGYVEVSQDGGAFAFGNALYEGSLPSIGVSATNVVAEAPFDGGQGYCMLRGNGYSYCFEPGYGGGLAPGGSELDMPCAAVGMAATSNDGGFWYVDACGDVYTTGDAGYYGGFSNVSGLSAQSDVVGIADLSLSGVPGYCILTNQGDTYCFNADDWNPSTQVATLGPGGYQAPVSSCGLTSATGINATADDQGYWLVDACGSVYAIGDAPYYGNASEGEPYVIVGVAPTADGAGYWLVGADGGVVAFGDAYFLGSTSDTSDVNPSGGNGVVSIGTDP
jgi:hypothetical protein